MLFQAQDPMIPKRRNKQQLPDIGNDKYSLKQVKPLTNLYSLGRAPRSASQRPSTPGPGSYDPPTKMVHFGCLRFIDTLLRLMREQDTQCDLDIK